MDQQVASDCVERSTAASGAPRLKRDAPGLAHRILESLPVILAPPCRPSGLSLGPHGAESPYSELMANTYTAAVPGGSTGFRYGAGSISERSEHGPEEIPEPSSRAYTPGLAWTLVASATMGSSAFPGGVTSGT